MPGVTFTDPEAWFAGLAGVVVAAGGLITDPLGRVLLVKPNYRDRWTIPGGICELAESPQDGCGRELAEELGLPIAVGRLLAVDWGLPHGPQARGMLHFIFDGGQLDDGSAIVLQESELDGFSFVAPAELDAFLPDTGLHRVRGALRARAAGRTSYLPGERSAR